MQPAFRLLALRTNHVQCVAESRSLRKVAVLEDRPCGKAVLAASGVEPSLLVFGTQVVAEGF